MGSPRETHPTRHGKHPRPELADASPPDTPHELTGPIRLSHASAPRNPLETHAPRPEELASPLGNRLEVDMSSSRGVPIPPAAISTIEAG